MPQHRPTSTAHTGSKQGGRGGGRGTRTGETDWAGAGQIKRGAGESVCSRGRARPELLTAGRFVGAGGGGGGGVFGDTLSA